MILRVDVKLLCFQDDEKLQIINPRRLKYEVKPESLIWGLL